MTTRTFRKPMARSQIKADPVTSEVRAFVLVRDRGCIAVKVDTGHVCQDQWGNVHAAGDLARLTLDHVKDAPRLGRRAPSDPAHLVAMCWAANVLGWASAHRAEERAYLRAVADPEPEHTHVDPVFGCDSCYRGPEATP